MPDSNSTFCLSVYKPCRTNFGCKNFDTKCHSAFRHRSTCVCASKEINNGPISLSKEAHAKRHVKVFGGEEVVLDGPIFLDIVMCGVHIVHPLFT